MWIKELCGENFSGMNFHDTYERNEVIISGPNKSGKSTRIKAFFWLLSGYTDAVQPMNSNLYDNRVELSKDTPEAHVWAKVVLDNNEEYMIERIARAKYQRRRGSDVWEKSASDEYLYKIDNIARTASDFREWISENIVAEDFIRFCLDGSFFINLLYEDKRKARALIEKVVGTVTREEMTGDYADINDLLQKYTPDEIDMQSLNLAKSIGKRLDEIPALIQNIEKEISEIEQTDFAATDSEIAGLESKRSEYSKQLTDLSERMKPVLEARKNAESEREMKILMYNDAKDKYEKGWIEQDNKLCLEISKIDEQNRILNKEKAQLHEMNVTDERIIREYEESCQKLRDEKDAIKKETFDCGGVCPVCGAPLSEETKEKELAAWEKRQREKIDGIVLRGREINRWIDGLKAKIEGRVTKMNEMTIVDTEPLRQKLNDLRTKDIPPFAETEQGKTLQADIDAVQIPHVEMPEDKEIKDHIDKINQDLVPLYERRGLKSRLQSLKNQTEALRSEQKEKGSEMAKYERRRSLVKQFKQEQMEILSRKVNEGLRHSRIEVWSQQKDGTNVADLVIKDANGVRFESTNNASRIIATCDLQRFFCEKLGVNLPTFVDESSVLEKRNLPHYDTQMFFLFCSETPLTIESK